MRLALAWEAESIAFQCGFSFVVFQFFHCLGFNLSDSFPGDSIGHLRTFVIFKNNYLTDSDLNIVLVIVLLE